MSKRNGSRFGVWLGSLGLVAIAALGLTGIVPESSEAARIRLQADFDPPSTRALGTDGVAVEAPGCATLGSPGHPLLPARRMIVLLPPGEKVVAVRAIASADRGVDGTWRVAWAQTPRPISLGQPDALTPADPAVYGTDAPFPAQRFQLVDEQTLWGHRMAFLQIYPVVYRPASGELSWSEKIEVEVETAPVAGSDPARIANLRKTEAVDQRIASLVDNPQDLALYAGAAAAPARATRLTADFYPYVIITTPEMAEGYQALARLEASHGLRTRIVLLDEITLTYPGIDAAEQVRNFIIDAYQNWQLQYVMLGGDSDMIPLRNLYCDAGGTIDSFPGDCYYEALDGTWDDDHDGVWGEPEEADMAGEIAVGRVTARNPVELNNWLHKNEMYTDHPVVAEIQKALFMGERMDDVPTWAGAYMDDVIYYCCDWGYCTSGYPTSYIRRKLYDNPVYSWTAAEAIEQFNAGFPTSHHLGHANTTYGMKMVNSDVQYFTNDGVNHSYSFISTQGCYSNNWDNGGSPSISEAFLLDDNCASAFLGNTRYGWYCPGYDIGPSQHYDRQLVDARYAEGISAVGRMNVDSKIDNIWQMDPWNRWCHYELTLLGDPAMPQWNTCLGTLAVSHATTYVMGQGLTTVTVTSNGAPVAGATVSIYSDDLDAWASGVTDAQGAVSLDPSPIDPSTLRVKAVKTDYLPGTGDIQVDPGMQAWLEWDSTMLDDDAVAPSVGDGDGMADLAETNQFLLRVRNIGHVAAEGVTAVISTSDSRVEILDPAAAYGTIGGISSTVNGDDILVRILDSVSDGDVVLFDVVMACDGGRQWTGQFSITLHAPILSLASWSIDDTAAGDGDGKIEPGEPFAIRVVLGNSGSDQGREIEAQIATDTPYVTMLATEAGHPSVPAGGSAELIPPFQGSLEPAAPTESFVHFTLHATTWCGQALDAAFDARVQSYYEDILEQPSAWIIGAADDNATQGIWTRGDPIGTWRSGAPVQPEDDHSADGTICFVTGQGTPGGTANASDVDGGKTTLTSPAIDLRGSVHPKLIYWRWYTNNLAQFPNQDTWQVDISSNGGQTWVSLESTTGSANNWARMAFDLDGVVQKTADVRIRFTASDYGYDSLVEAAIDDVSIENQPLPADAGDQTVPLTFALHPIAPNPCVPSARGIAVRYDLPRAGSVSLRLYDVTGALVRTLVDGSHAAGNATVIWDGRDEAGHTVAAGIYFARLMGPGGEAVRKVAILSAR